MQLWVFHFKISERIPFPCVVGYNLHSSVTMSRFRNGYRNLVSSEDERGIIAGLKNSGGTRTNIGLAEYSGKDTDVSILFYTTEQENLFLNRNDPVEPVVPANSHLQLLNIFQRIDGLRDIAFEKVKAEVVVENGGLIYSYATTIDNESGDPTAFTTAKE